MKYSKYLPGRLPIEGGRQASREFDVKSSNQATYFPPQVSGFLFLISMLDKK